MYGQSISGSGEIRLSACEKHSREICEYLRAGLLHVRTLNSEAYVFIEAAIRSMSPQRDTSANDAAITQWNKQVAISHTSLVAHYVYAQAEVAALNHEAGILLKAAIASLEASHFILQDREVN